MMVKGHEVVEIGISGDGKGRTMGEGNSHYVMVIIVKHQTSYNLLPSSLNTELS